MSTSEPSIAPTSSLHNAVDIVVAPGAAFERIRRVPGWGWVFLIATVLAILGSLLSLPASTHAFGLSAPALYAPIVAKMPPEKQSEALAQMIKVGGVMNSLEALFLPVGLLLGSLISAVIMLIANAVSRGDGTFKRFFALSMALTIITSLGLVLNGLITLVRGPSSYETIISVKTALPNLALVVPGAGGKLLTFLGVLNIASIWATVLTALGMMAVGNVKPLVAWTAAVASLLVAAGLAAAFTP